MLHSVHRAKTTALAVAVTGLTAIFSGVLPAATAAPAGAQTAESAAAAGSDDWFVDPRTPAERRAQITVPRDPKTYDGKVRETRSAFRTHAGDLAVPLNYAFGHTLKKGQAVTLNGEGSFFETADELTADGRQKLGRLALALANASSIRCEGYADYAGAAKLKHDRARRRAAAICSALAARTKVQRTTTATYGPTHPAVVGGDSEDRRLNRRVVVQMTGTRPASPTPPPATVFDVPSAPTGLTVAGHDGVLTTTFGLPANDGGSPVINFEISYDGGDTWEPATIDGDAPWTVVRHGFTNGTVYDVRVRASNASGHGPAATAEALVATVPGAPTEVRATTDGTTVTVSFTAPNFDGGTPVTGYQVRVDNGDWASVTLVGEVTSFLLASQPIGTHTYEVRAVNGRGVSPASHTTTAEIAATQPDAPTIQYFGYNSWSAAWEVRFEAGATNGATVTGWEASVDGGPWLTPAEVVDANGQTARFPCSNGDCGWSYSTPVRLRAVTATGFSQPSEPYVHDRF